jgi:hypothetical protein
VSVGENEEQMIAQAQRKSGEQGASTRYHRLLKIDKAIRLDTKKQESLATFRELISALSATPSSTIFTLFSTTLSFPNADNKAPAASLSNSLSLARDP